MSKRDLGFYVSSGIAIGAGVSAVWFGKSMLETVIGSVIIGAAAALLATYRR